MKKKIFVIICMIFLLNLSAISVIGTKVNSMKDPMSDDKISYLPIFTSGSDINFGWSVSIDGDYALVGAPYEDNNDVDTGSAYIFKRDGNSWQKQVKLMASDGDFADNFGCSVSIDGDYAIVGTDDYYDIGSAYIFKRDGNTWTEQIKLTNSGNVGDEYDLFGYSVSIDGDYALVGAYGEDDNGRTSGAAFVFKREGDTWNQQAKLLASDGTELDGFGWSVLIDGEYALIGAINDDDKGSAYVFKRDGDTWTEQAKLLASDGEDGDRFGWSVSIDGNYALIGASNWHSNNEDDVGSAYVFKRDGDTWTEQAKLLASDGEDGDRFGWSVSIDGNYALIGASNWHSNNEDDVGSAYVFKRDGDTWTEQEELIPKTKSKSMTHPLFQIIIEKFPLLAKLLRFKIFEK